MLQILAVVQPQRERLDACLVFPSMPAVMRLNKLGTFSMAQLGQSKVGARLWQPASFCLCTSPLSNWSSGVAGGLALELQASSDSSIYCWCMAQLSRIMRKFIMHTAEPCSWDCSLCMAASELARLQHMLHCSLRRQHECRAPLWSSCAVRARTATTLRRTC